MDSFKGKRNGVQQTLVSRGTFSWHVHENRLTVTELLNLNKYYMSAVVKTMEMELISEFRARNPKRTIWDLQAILAIAKSNPDWNNVEKVDRDRINQTFERFYMLLNELAANSEI